MAIRDAFTREFKKGNFDAGLSKGVDKIDSALSEARAEAGGSAPAARPRPAAGRRQAPAPAGRGIPVNLLSEVWVCCSRSASASWPCSS